MNPDLVSTALGIAPRSGSATDPNLLRDGVAGLARRIDELLIRAARDAAIAAASGRWRVGQPDPERYRPGDVVALRAFSVAADLTRARSYLPELVRVTGKEVDDTQIEALERMVLTVADVGQLFDAVPHFIEADAAVGVLSSRPPDAASMAELRLPYPQIAVFFGRSLEIGTELQDWPADWDLQTDLSGKPTGNRSAMGDIRALGGGLEGVVISEAPGGGLSDDVLWLVSANPDPTRTGPSRLDRFRAVVWGRLSASRLAHVAHNLAATVSWAEWREPARRLELPSNPASGDWRKAVRRGEFRRHEPYGATAAVRVLDVSRTPVSDRIVDTPAGSAAHNSPVTHLRRAHWRHQRVGTGLAQRRLVRVPATVVNPGGAPLGAVVYRIPTPDEATPTRVDAGVDEPHLDLSKVALPGARRPDVDTHPERRPEVMEVAL